MSVEILFSSFLVPSFIQSFPVTTSSFTFRVFQVQNWHTGGAFQQWVAVISNVVSKVSVRLSMFMYY